ncbi:hypothetical protein LTR56_023071 [Elasticomyces elasticus]|nr:hypothetical protein LTR56_023071 [Elasticomyces elasticus]KAK3623348.1 hypothetical protein LTR22_024427 [Elasticomyces elasticus]KAK4907290.1 hypothetical protein LTR49_023660 [Elasticomyces elasticus]KAK5747768.1 hypothetical protein LTS12_022167 [Elasticomyces elasticus]
MASVDYDDRESIDRTIGMDLSQDALAIPTMISLDDAKHQSRPRIADIFRDYTSLSDILKLHEATVQKRWAMESKVQRLKILLNASPEMAASHRPDYLAFRKETPQQRLSWY